MASLSLRAYLQKIENLIDRGETDEAIAHCKHILKKFPKHVDTYRLLGKSYLEMQRYQEASDVLQRVLSVVPDDFVSQIGMSIIRENSENLDEAIWHMERAFEIQPSNNAVQDELKRLYGRRDGVIPQKILLTRGALVRMYVRGEAYPQAIAEGIAALKEDPQRADIQLLLAKSYLRTNQINEGYRICQKILESLPFSYEANQLIAEIHILTKQSEQAEPYLEHVRMLDPYAAFVNENAPTSAKVDENAIIIDELDYDEMAMALESADAAQKSMYVEDDFDTSSLEIPTAGDSQPIEIDEDFSWMQEMMNDSASETSAENQPAQEVKPNEESDFPFESVSDFENTPSDNIFENDSSSDDDAFAALFAEMNDAPDSSMTEPEPTSTPAQDDQAPMTMAEFFESTDSENKIEKDEAEDQTIDDFAAFFEEQNSDQKTPPEHEALPEEQPPTDNIDSVMIDSADEDFASFFEEQSESIQAQPDEVEKKLESVAAAESSDDLPDWLKELDQESKDGDIEGDLQKEIDSLFTNGDLPSSSEQSDAGTPDKQLDDEEEFTAKFLDELESEPQHPGKTRMFSMTADLSSGDSGPLPPLQEDVSPAEKATEEEIPDWLKQLEEQTNEFGGTDEELPSAQMQEQTTESAPSSIDSMSEEEEDLLREQYKSAQQTTNTTQMLSEDEDDDGFSWLESLAAKQNSAEDSPPIEQLAVESMEDETVEPDIQEPIQQKSASSIDAMTEEEEDRLREQFKSTEQTGSDAQMLSDDDDDSFAWLESLAAKQGASESPIQPEQTTSEELSEELVEATESEEMPQKSASSIDSMTEEEEERLREQFKSSQQTNSVSQDESEDDSFAWLESLAAKQGVSEDTLLSSEEERGKDIPEWLQETISSDEEEQPITTPEPTTAAANPVEMVDLSEEEPVTISKLEQSEIIEEAGPETEIEEPVWVDEFATSEPISSDEILPSVSESPESVVEEIIEEKPDKTISSEDIPVLQQEIEETPVEESPKQKIIDTPQTPDDIPEWLKDLEEQTSIYAMTDNDDVGQNIIDIDDVEIPGWITDVNETQQIDVEETEEEEFEDIPEVHTEFISSTDIEEEEQTAEAFESIGLDINELERKLEQEKIIEHVDGEKSGDLIEDTTINEPLQVVEPETVSTSEDDKVTTINDEEPLKPEEELVFDIPSDFVDEILQEPEPTGPIPDANESDTQLLAEMGILFSQNNIAEALAKADQLIEKEVFLSKIIDELNKAIIDHPLDPSIFVRLGDAYIRNNEIQKALDMYQEAETLLQK